MNYSFVVSIWAAFLNFKTISSFPKLADSFGSVSHDLIDPYDMPESCIGQSFCTVKGDEYPQDDVDELLRSMPMDIEEIETFGSGAFDPESDCEAVYSREPIYYIRDEANKTRAVVQSSDPNGYHQLFDLRVCASEGHLQRSRYFLKTSGVHVSCSTSYLLYDFFVLSHGAELELERVKAPLPVCCKCEIEKKSLKKMILEANNRVKSE